MSNQPIALVCPRTSLNRAPDSFTYADTLMPSTCQLFNIVTEDVYVQQALQESIQRSGELRSCVHAILSTSISLHPLPVHTLLQRAKNVLHRLTKMRENIQRQRVMYESIGILCRDTVLRLSKPRLRRLHRGSFYLLETAFSQ